MYLDHNQKAYKGVQYYFKTITGKIILHLIHVTET
jgi:hypothetical protein